VTSADDVPASTDVVLAWEPEASTVDGLHGRGLKVAAVNAPDVAADLHLAPDELRSFAERVSDLFRVT
jgi:hypothetical protein